LYTLSCPSDPPEFGFCAHADLASALAHAREYADYHQAAVVVRHPDGSATLAEPDPHGVQAALAREFLSWLYD
jgi:hypothetical protein